MASDLRAFIVGLLVFVGGVFAFFETSILGSATATPSVVSYIIAYSTPMLSGAVCALLAGRRRFGVLLCLGVAGAAAFTIVGRLWSMSGFTLALGGVSETEWVFGISLLTVPLLVMIGGWFGVHLRHRFTSRAAS
jgi:hypothetical protein